MLRIALFTGNYNYAIDGVARTMNRLVGFLENVGIPVRVFAPTAAKPLFPHKGTLVSVPSVQIPTNPYRLALGLPPSVRRELRAFAPTVIHLHTPDLLGFAALRWGRFHNIPVVTTYHTHFSGYLKYYRMGLLDPVVWWLMRRFYKQCDQVFVAAASMATELRQHGVCANYVEAPFGVDTNQFHPGRRSLEWRRSLGIGDNEVVVSFIGRLVWEKGLAVFADVLNRLHADGVKFRSLVVGDGLARAGFEAMLPDAIYTGYLTDDALSTAFASADVFFNPSASETFGCVTVESLASGLAVVAADAPGSRDIIRGGVDGILCPPEDRDAFAVALRQLIENSAVRAALRQSGLQRATSYRWDIVLEAMVGNYEKACVTSRK
ncbi:MAG TPA: glycosyltransferase family 1 protein [Gemmata sp.]|jgi:glycosyltransferase involved in cell wall biosynthesis|nr:glycosyltransferase family 1 protein [Gemmata sp.]